MCEILFFINLNQSILAHQKHLSYPSDWIKKIVVLIQYNFVAQEVAFVQYFSR